LPPRRQGRPSTSLPVPGPGGAAPVSALWAAAGARDPAGRRRQLKKRRSLSLSSWSAVKLAPAKAGGRIYPQIENILSVLTQYKHARADTKNTDRLVWRLNLKITGCIYEGNRFGWVFFFSQINDIGQLARLDSFVTEELKRRELATLRPRIKRFTRSYHEINLNLKKSRYIPKYDGLDVEEMVAELSNAEGNPREHYIEHYNEQEIRRKFFKLISYQTRLLERDLIEAIS
jgi:hypothetical protein